MLYEGGISIVDLVAFMGTESGLAVGFGKFNTSMGIQEKVTELMRPLLACEFESGLQFSQEVGIAQGVGAVGVAEVGMITVMNRDTPEAGEHIDGIEGLSAPPVINMETSESISRDHVQLSILPHANTGFIAVYGRRLE
ncbi:MAG: hypothetical protein R6U70_02240 [Bacillota bacterium]